MSGSAAVRLPTATRPRQLLFLRGGGVSRTAAPHRTAAPVGTDTNSHEAPLDDGNEAHCTPSQPPVPLAPSSPPAATPLRKRRGFTLLPRGGRCGDEQPREPTTAAAKATAHTADGASSGESSQLTATPLRDWEAPLALPPASLLRVVHKRGLYALRSHFNTLLAWDGGKEHAVEREKETEATSEADGRCCYSLSAYPSACDAAFPSLFNLTIALSGSTAAVYIVDALRQHRLQLSGGRLQDWQSGERREKRKTSRKETTASRSSARTAQRDGGSSGESGSDTDTPTSPFQPDAPAELTAGLTFFSLSAEPANPRSMLFHFLDPLSSRYLSAKRDGRVTALVRRQSSSEQWRLVPLAELGFHSLAQAAAACEQWTAARRKRRSEQREAERRQAYIDLWPEQQRVAAERVAAWRSEVRGVSRASYAACSDDDAQKLLTLHFDQSERATAADDGSDSGAMHRFSASGLRRRLQPAAVPWRVAQHIALRKAASRSELEVADGADGRDATSALSSRAVAGIW